MPQTVDYLGQKVEFPDDMSQADMLSALQNDESLNLSIKDGNQLTVPPGNILEYAGFQGTQRRLGASDMYSFFRSVGDSSVWSKIWEDISTVQEGSALDKPGVGTELVEEYHKNFRKHSEESSTILTNIFGWDKPDLDLLPEDQTQAIFGMGNRMMTDPINLLSGGTKNLLEFGVRGAINAARWFGIGVSSSSSAVLASELEEFGADFLGVENPEMAGAIVGVGTALFTGYKTQNFTNRLASGATSILQGKSWSHLKSTASTYEQKFAIANTRNVLKEIAKAEKKDVEKIVDDFRQISHYFDDVDIPFFLTLTDNPVVVGELNKLIRKYPQVRAKVDAELAKIEAAIISKSNELFGSPIVGKALEAQVSPEVITKSLRSQTDILKQRIEAINSRIEDLSVSYMPKLTKEELGLKIENLVRAKKKTAQALRSIEYETILKGAEKNKIFMPPEGVEQIWAYVKSVRLDDKFGQGTPIHSKINNLLKPKIKVTKTEGPAGKTTTTKEEIFSEMSFANVDSLKKAINKQLRRKLSADVRYQLEDLKGVLDDARTKIPGAYSAALDVADMNYYKFIGLPFTEQGIKEISSAKYAEKIAPVIVSNAEALTDFLNVVGGTKGLDIAKNAFLAEVWKNGFVDNALNPAKFKTIMKNKSEVIDMIPGLREELMESLKTEGYLSLRVNNLNKEFKAQEKIVGEHFLAVKYGDRSTGVEAFQPSKLVDDMINNRDSLIKITNDIRMLPVEIRGAVQNTLRRQFLDNIGLRRDSLKWLMDSENTYTVQRIMGKGYQNDLRAFARLTDRINKISIEKVANMPMNPIYDVIEKKTGIPLTAVVSIIRRPIISPPQKALIMSSRIWSGKRGSAADKLMTKILLSDLNALDEFYKLERLSKIKRGGMSDTTLVQKFTDILVGSIPALIAVKGGVAREQIQQDLGEQMEEYEAAVFQH
jgi:hypothetical protein